MLAGKSFIDKANDNYEFEEYEAALINFDKALQINPQNPEAHFGKSVALYTLDKKEAALVAVEKAIEINPQGENFYGFKGGILLSMGQKEAALAAFQKALEINPNDSPCAANIGDCLADLGKFKEAVDAYDHAIKIDPKNKSAYSDKGFVLYLVGEIDEAIKWYDRQIETASSISDMWVPYFRKGTALQDLNKDTEAWEYFQKGMDIFNQGELEGNRFIFSNGEDEILNVLEVQLISGIKGLFALPTLPVAQDDSEEVKTRIQDFNRKRDVLKLKFINAAFSTKKNRYSHPQEEFDQLKKELEEVKNMHKKITNEIAQIKADIQSSSLKEVTEVKKGFKDLEEQDPELLAYCKTFYWLATNLFSAYRAQNEDLLVTEVKKATNLLADIASGTPIVGEVLNQLNTIIDGINGGVKENNFNNKVTAINKVIQAKFGAEDDISLNISKIAIAITLAKKKTILYPEISSPGFFIISQKIKSGLEWLSSQVDDIKDKVLPFVELQDIESIGATLALQDVILFMAYICKNHKYIIKRKEGLDKQIVSIVECNGLEQLLEGRADAADTVDTFETTLEVKNSKATPEVTQEVKNPEGCNCAMF